MVMPCRCFEDHPGDQPTFRQLKAALARSLVEIDALRMMLDLPALECRRTIDWQALEDGDKLGLVVKMENGSLVCWPES